MNFGKHVKVREEKFGSVIFETLREKVFVTNESGSEILHLLKKGKNFQDIIRKLTEDYNEVPEVIKNDVDMFVCILKDNGIIKVEE